MSAKVGVACRTFEMRLRVTSRREALQGYSMLYWLYVEILGEVLNVKTVLSKYHRTVARSKFSYLSKTVLCPHEEPRLLFC